MKTETKKVKKFPALDVLIIVLLLLCVAGIAVRTVIGENGLFQGDNRGTYTVSYTVKGARGEYNEYFKDSTKFYLENGEILGSLSGEAVSLPSQIISENSKGEYVQTLATDGTVDIKGTVKVEGTMTNSGFLLNSGTYIAPNMTLSVRSADLTVEMLITDIVKAQ